MEREGKKIKKRNLAKVKILKERPERLKSKRREITEEEEEDSEWFDMPNSKADPLGGQDAQVEQAEGAGGGLEHQAEGHQHPPEAEAGQPRRAQGTPVKERWEVALGPWKPKAVSSSPRDRKRKQQEARKRDKEKSQHPYQLRNRKGREFQEEEELSD